MLLGKRRVSTPGDYRPFPPLSADLSLSFRRWLSRKRASKRDLLWEKMDERRPDGS